MDKKNTKLKDFFPMIRERETIIDEISSNPKLNSIFNSWRTDQQEEFLNILTGAKGVKMLYDSYFKEILSPEQTPERLSTMLSIILGQNVKVKSALPNDSTRLGDEYSLIITDIVVELEDGSIANVEVQKIGYAFLGKRASCYSADLLLRQYKRVRDTQKENFYYKSLNPVYTIVFMEKSPACFHEFKDYCIHSFKLKSNSGLELDLLQNFIFIPIDIFLQKLHNEGITNELDEWLTFLGCDEPEYVTQLIQRAPYFKLLYDDLYNMCLNTEGMMTMFSKELQILDRNTVKYMIDELQAEIKEKDAVIAENNAALADKENIILKLQAELEALKNK